MQSNTSGQRIRANSYLEKNREREDRENRLRVLFMVACLTVLLPPLGLLLVWRSRRVNAMARIVLSMAGMASMTIIFSVLLNSGGTDPGILPVPVVPDYAGYDSTVSAVSVPNEPQPADDTGYTVTYGDGTVDMVGGELPTDPALDVTLVYAVTNNATYYHAQQVCDLQTNSRVLTLDDAIAEGLLPCPKCAADPAGGLEPAAG